MEDVQGGYLSYRKNILPNSRFWLSYYLLKIYPKIGIQLPTSVDDNQSCHILTVIFNLIDQLPVQLFNIYSSTLFYKNVSISTVGNIISLFA